MWLDFLLKHFFFIATHNRWVKLFLHHTLNESAQNRFEFLIIWFLCVLQLINFVAKFIKNIFSFKKNLAKPTQWKVLLVCKQIKKHMLVILECGIWKLHIWQSVVAADRYEHVTKHLEVIPSTGPIRSQSIEGLKLIIDIEHAIHFFLLQMLICLQVDIRCHIWKISNVNSFIIKHAFMHFVFSPIYQIKFLILSQRNLVKRNIIMDVAGTVNHFDDLKNLYSKVVDTYFVEKHFIHAA